MAGVGGVLAGSRRLSWGRSGSSAGGTSVGGANGAGVGAGMAVAAEEDRGWRRRSGLEYDDELEEEGYGGVSSCTFHSLRLSYPLALRLAGPFD